MYAHVKEADPPESPRRWQFSLRSLLLLCVLVSLSCVPSIYLGSDGWLLSMGLMSLVALGWALAMSQRFTRVEILICITLPAILMAALMPAVKTGPRCGSASYSNCQNNLQKIERALLEYETVHGTFPPAYVADADGRPMHSWRVLILPQLGEQTLYDAYDFDEPWDGPNNSKLHNRMPKIFQCPCESTDQSELNPRTSYLAVVGEQTMWPGAVAREKAEVRDEHKNTIHFVEVHNSGVHWMEPRDLELEAMSAVISSGPAGRTISSQHGRGANAAFADGHVQYLLPDIDSRLLDAFLTVDGGEAVPAEYP